MPPSEQPRRPADGPPRSPDRGGGGGLPCSRRRSKRHELAENGNRKGESGLIAALAAGQTVKDAAAGVSERTAHRRLEDADSRQEVGAARARLVDAAPGQLADASAEAVTTLRALLHAGSDTARLGAARPVLEFGTKLRESVEFEARIARLEAAQP